MDQERLDNLYSTLTTSQSEEERTECLGLIVTGYLQVLSTDMLFSLMPFIWSTSLRSKYGLMRGKIEGEIKSRQNLTTVAKLLEFLNSENSNLRFVAVELLNAFKRDMVIEPLIEYIKTTGDSTMWKRQAVGALNHYYHDSITELFIEEYNTYKDKQDGFMINNYLITLELNLKERGIDVGNNLS